MDDRPYFYRVRGRTLGPVPLRQMRQLAQRAQIGRMTDVSRDGLQWGKAADCPEIFDAGVAADGGIGGPPPVDPLAMTVSAPAVTTTASPQWYYAKGGVQKGPVDLSTLQQMVATGQLAPSDHVFPEDGTDWMTVSSVPVLAGGMGVGAPVVNVSTPREPSVGSAGANGLAIAGFVLSLVAIVITLFGCLCWPLWGISAPAALIGTILSGVAMSGKNKSQRGLAVTGMVLGVISILLLILGVILLVVGVLANAQQMDF